MEHPFLRRTWAEIDLDALAYNYSRMRGHMDPSVKFLGVVKANAYGHGALPVSRKLEELGADYLAVATLDEARELRQGGVGLPILILGHTPAELTFQLAAYGITQSVSSCEAARQYSAAAAACGKPLAVHIKVDTGMSRLGFPVAGGRLHEGVRGIVQACALPFLEAEGIFTHFSVADESDQASQAYTREQLDLFLRVVGALAEAGRTFPLHHCANSGAFVRYPESHLDMVRPGIALYGAGGDAARLGLRPVMALKSCIYAVRELDEGTHIGYGRTFRTAGPSRIGVIPAGYADGLPRGLSNRMSVQTHQGAAPVRGHLCMDMAMVDLSRLPLVREGDEVELFGRQQRVDELAALLGTIPYELLCAVSSRVPRRYLSK